MDELKIKKLIEKNKKLLEERTQLQLEQYDKRYEIKELEEQIITFSNVEQNYRNLKKEKIKNFIINMLQMGAIFCSISIGLGLNFFNINPATLKIINTFFSIVYGSLGGVLLVSYQDELKDYKKIMGEEYFDKNELKNIEEIKKVKTDELEKIDYKVNINTKKLDNIYNMSVNQIIISPSNNEYLNEDNNVKLKQKKIEKRK